MLHTSRLNIERGFGTLAGKIINSFHIRDNFLIHAGDKKVTMSLRFPYIYFDWSLFETLERVQNCYYLDNLKFYTGY